MMSAARNTNGRFPAPFTSIQWQELEHQALVYKYIISGMPIPPDLLFSIRTSLDSSTNLVLHHQSPHQSIGWNCFQMGFGRKIDPEPGRCRRTDGKKWRCSKEAYPDSKYCERHMHRGRNRSRKPVEVTPNTPPLSIATKSPNYPSPTSHPPFIYPQLSSSRPPGNVLSSQDHFLLESSPYSHSQKDYRNSYGVKEEEDKHPFFSENTGPRKAMADSWHLETPAMNNPSSPGKLKQRSFSDYQNGNSYLQLQSTPKKQEKQDESCYDQSGLKIDRKDEPLKVMHHFFDEWPHSDDHNQDSSATQLSISIPTSAHDFFLTHNDK